MYLTIDLRKSSKLRDLVHAAFPSYRKHKATVTTFNGPEDVSSYWDRGSRAKYATVSLTGRRVELPRRQGRRAIWGYQLFLDTLPEGVALIEAGTFCDKPATVRIKVNETDLAQLTGEATHD